MPPEDVHDQERCNKPCFPKNTFRPGNAFALSRELLNPTCLSPQNFHNPWAHVYFIDMVITLWNLFHKTCGLVSALARILLDHELHHHDYMCTPPLGMGYYDKSRKLISPQTLISQPS